MQNQICLDLQLDLQASEEEPKIKFTFDQSEEYVELSTLEQSTISHQLDDDQDGSKTVQRARKDRCHKSAKDQSWFSKPMRCSF